jgi:phosphoribosylaminoimidazolecarboxamide formyltransferase/IMP cyclohydrolase
VPTSAPGTPIRTRRTATWWPISEPVDAELVDLLRRLPGDGIVPGYAPGTVEVLAAKKGGRYLVLEADPEMSPPDVEVREVGGLRLGQPRDDVPLTRELVAHSPLGEPAVADLLLGLVVLRFTLSNSVAYVRDGMAPGVGEGQLSRVDCARLAGAKTDTRWLRRHPRADLLLRRPVRPWSGRTGGCASTWIGASSPGWARWQAWIPHRSPPPSIVTGSAGSTGGSRLGRCDPFRDDIDHAARHGVRHLAEPADRPPLRTWSALAGSTASHGRRPLLGGSTTDPPGHVSRETATAAVQLKRCFT